MSNNLISNFTKYVKTNNLFTHSDKILVAISGGVDSIVLTTILNTKKYNIEAVHCNFHLRGTDSDNDELFVKEFCKKSNIKLHIKHFDTIKYASDNKISIEMAARELRYSWFTSLKNTIKANYICTGHHLNDQAETLILNQVRGTGIKGLCAMSPKSNSIVRPLLFASRNDIEEFANKQKLTSRIDKTNYDTKFKRNKIRHSIIPELQTLNPALLNTLNKNISKINNIWAFLEQHYNEIENTIVFPHSNYILFKLPTDKNKFLFSDFIHYYFEKNNIKFNVDEVIKLSIAQTGKFIENTTHQLWKERQGLILTTTNNNKPTTFEINSFPKDINWNGTTYNFIIIEDFDIKNMPKTTNHIWVDYNKISLPITIKSWHNGQTMKPLGLNGTKKIKDLLTNAKVFAYNKQNYPIITSNNSVIWLPSIRMGNNFAVTEKTEKILSISSTR